MKNIEKIKKTLKTISVIFFSIIILLLTGLIAFSMLSKNDHGVKYIGNVAIIRILSNSMSPIFSEGDYIVIEKVNSDDLKEGDIITFVSSDPAIKGSLNTHKIERFEGEQIVTKGVNNPAEDHYRVNKADVVGRYTKTLAFLGSVFRLLSSTQGFILLILVPMLIVISLYIKDFVSSLKQNTTDNKNETKDGNNKYEQKEKELIEATIKEMKESGELDRRIEEINNKNNH